MNYFLHLSKTVLLTTSILLLIVCFSKRTLAQKQIANQHNGWYMYFGNHKISEKVSLHTEYQWRRSEVISEKAQTLLRLGIDYKTKSGPMLSTGYGYIVTWPYGEQPVGEKFREHRIWEQLILTQQAKRFYFHHRYRLEQRWLEGNGGTPAEGYTYRNRARYRFLFGIPLSKPEMGEGVLFFSMYDEVFVQFGKSFDRNYFDQNRLYTAFGYQFSPQGNVQLGYLNQYIVKGDGLKAERNHTLQLAITYNMDFRKSTE